MSQSRYVVEPISKFVETGLSVSRNPGELAANCQIAFPDSAVLETRFALKSTSEQEVGRRRLARDSDR
jgi:hypothetical protein